MDFSKDIDSFRATMTAQGLQLPPNSNATQPPAHAATAQYAPPTAIPQATPPAHIISTVPKKRQMEDEDNGQPTKQSKLNLDNTGFSNVMPDMSAFLSITNQAPTSYTSRASALPQEKQEKMREYGFGSDSEGEHQRRDSYGTPLPATDKRKRNCLASARFRQKKKAEMQMLEEIATQKTEECEKLTHSVKMLQVEVHYLKHFMRMNANTQNPQQLNNNPMLQAMAAAGNNSMAAAYATSMLQAANSFPSNLQTNHANVNVPTPQTPQSAVSPLPASLSTQNSFYTSIGFPPMYSSGLPSNLPINPMTMSGLGMGEGMNLQDIPGMTVTNSNTSDVSRANQTQNTQNAQFNPIMSIPPQQGHSSGIN